MRLTKVYDAIRPSIVALGSRLVVTRAGEQPSFPEIVGTGFVVDRRGIIATNQHVVEALQKLPSHPVTGSPLAFAIVWGKVEDVGDTQGLPLLFVDIKSFNQITRFSVTGPSYGEPRPDLAFVQLNVCDLPALSLETEPGTLRIGQRVATSGFPMGTDALVQYSRVVQLTPLLREGIISSVYPFPCLHPHGFTIDVMTQGGASGSPVFLADSPTVVGMVSSGFDGTNVTIALTSRLINAALSQCLRQSSLDLSGVPSLQTLLSQVNRERGNTMTWESFVDGRPVPR